MWRNIFAVFAALLAMAVATPANAFKQVGIEPYDGYFIVTVRPQLGDTLSELCEIMYGRKMSPRSMYNCACEIANLNPWMRDIHRIEQHRAYRVLMLPWQYTNFSNYKRRVIVPAEPVDPAYRAVPEDELPEWYVEEYQERLTPRDVYSEHVDEFNEFRDNVTEELAANKSINEEQNERLDRHERLLEDLQKNDSSLPSDTVDGGGAEVANTSFFSTIASWLGRYHALIFWTVAVLLLALYVFMQGWRRRHRRQATNGQQSSSDPAPQQPQPQSSPTHSAPEPTQERIPSDTPTQFDGFSVEVPDKNGAHQTVYFKAAPKHPDGRERGMSPWTGNIILRERAYKHAQDRLNSQGLPKSS